MEGGVSAEDDQDDDEQACCVSIHRVRRRMQFRGEQQGRRLLSPSSGRRRSGLPRERARKEGLGGRRGRGDGEDRRRRQQVSEAKLSLEKGGRESEAT